ncbi:MAG: hypothetical protein KJ011_05220 [Burkholderiaceae bacterium]|nr:hypothetical protein [Burkholderiaceae bacterium]
MSTTTIANPLPDGIAVVPPLEHVECAHVEFLEGTKEQLQAVGIGVGVAFPGEPGAQPRQITVRDPRGLKARIRPSYPRQGTGVYCVRIDFPPAEHERRRAELQERERLEALRKDAQEAGMTVEEWLSRGVHRSTDDYRDRICGRVEMLFEIIEEKMIGDCGYSFDASVLAQCEALAARILILIENGRIVLDRDAHQQALAEKRAERLAEYGIAHQAERPKPALRLVWSAPGA